MTRILVLVRVIFMHFMHVIFSCMFPPRFRNTETCDFVLYTQLSSSFMFKLWLLGTITLDLAVNISLIWFYSA